MKNKGFSLVELLLVIVLMSIITLIVMPSINNILKTGKDKKYTSIEDVVKTNLELYNIDYEEDLWSGDPDYIEVSYDDIKAMNSDINLDNCKVGYLRIDKSALNNYTYHACIKCDEEYTSSDEVCKGVSYE